MGFKAGEPMTSEPVRRLCRLAQWAAAAASATPPGSARKAREGWRAHVAFVPGSEAVKRQAERKRLDHIIVEAGAEWRLPGCSMCIAMNGVSSLRPACGVHQQPQFRGPPRAKSAHDPRQPGDAPPAAPHHRRADRPRTFANERPMPERFTQLTSHVRAAARKHRYRSDHSGALSHHHIARRLGQSRVL